MILAIVNEFQEVVEKILSYKNRNLRNNGMLNLIIFFTISVIEQIHRKV
jgi:hypothetical protein